MKLRLPNKSASSLKKLVSARSLYVLIGLVALIGAGVLGQFLYQNFYLTITQAQDVIILRQEVAPDTINVEKVNTVLRLIDQKAAEPAAQPATITKNPFNLPFIPSATTPGID